MCVCERERKTRHANIWKSVKMCVCDQDPRTMETISMLELDSGFTNQVKNLFLF